MIDLERSLGELAERLEVPRGDWLVADVLRRIDEPARVLTPRRSLRLVGVVVVVLAVALVAVPGPRRAIARWLGFDSVHIEPGAVTVATVPTSIAPATNLPSTTVVATSAAPVPELGLGVPVSITVATVTAPGSM